MIDALNSIEQFKEKLTEYITIAYELEDYEKTLDDSNLKNLNTELMTLLIENEDDIFHFWKLKNIHISTKNWYQWNIYYGILSNIYIYNLKQFSDQIIQDLIYVISKIKKEIKSQLKEDDAIDTLVINNELVADKDKITEIIEHSKINFFSSTATIQNKRDAIKALADALEHYRTEITKDYFWRKDENVLFQIANDFWLRHMKRNWIKFEYEEDIFYDWIYLTYYNALKLIINLIERKDKLDNF